MSTLSCTIGGIPVTLLDQSFTLTDAHGIRSTLQFVVADMSGTLSFYRGLPVVFTDSTTGNMFKGIVASSQPQKPSPSSPALFHSVSIVDSQYYVDKRVNTTNYAGFYAGDIIADSIDSTLYAEGITASYSRRHDSQITDWNQGTAINTIGVQTPSASIGDGQLQIASAGKDITITENTTAQFATGTLTNMLATSNTLMPTTINALKMQSTLSFSYGTEFAQAERTISGTISASPTGSVSGSLSGGSISGSLSGGSISGSLSGGSISGSANVTGSYTPSGSVNISGGAPGESASFSGNGGSINSSGSVSGSASGSVSGSASGSVTGSASGSVTGSVSTSFSTSYSNTIPNQYQPKTKSVVKIDATHYEVVTVDRAVVDNRVDAFIWSGSFTIGTHDTLNYDIYISSTSPSQEAGIELSFSDGTSLTEYLGTLGNNTDVGVWDQNLVSVSAVQDLSDYAKDTWYTRNIDLTILVGKVITGVSIFNAANIAGTYDIYIKNCYLGSQSGTPFFSTSQSTPSINPPVLTSIGAYITAATLITVIPVYLSATSSRVSAAYSIDAVKLVKSSIISWTTSILPTGPAVVPGSVGAATVPAVPAIFISYDATTWLSCTNNQPLPGLPIGANVAGMSLYLLEEFSGGQDPTAIPILMSVTLTLISAPSATTTDIIAAYGNTSEWNSGTEVGLAPNSNGDLVLGLTSYTWTNLSGMTYIPGYITDSDVVLPTQSTSSGAYVVTSIGDSDGDSWSSSRFNFISAAQNFTCEADFVLNSSGMIQNEIGLVYRQTFWGSPNNSFAYYVRIMQNSGGSVGGTSVTLGYGTNNPPATQDLYTSGPYTVLQQVSETISNGTTYHIKIVVAQNRHTIYWNGSSTPIIDILDNTYLTPGNIGLRTYVNAGNTNTSVNRIKNFTISNTFAGIWTSPSINLNSLGTCGNTQISWSEVTPSLDLQSTAIVQISLDGGATWKQCTNGSLMPTIPIPGLTVGTNVTGKSMIVQVVLSATSFLTNPVIMGLYIRVCGAYPGSSGTRSTVPIVNDYPILSRTVGSGWGTAFDGQTWVQVGTGTTSVGSGEALISNTTGDVHMVPGSNIWTDEDAIIQMKLSTSTMQGGLELRYTNTNNYYRLSISTTAISIIKRGFSMNTTLTTLGTTYVVGTKYSMRFRVVSNNPVLLYARTWPTGTSEPTTWTITGSD